MSDKVYKGFVFFVTAISFIVFPASEFTGVTDYFVGWLGIIFILFFCAGCAIIFAKSAEWFITEKIFKKIVRQEEEE